MGRLRDPKELIVLPPVAPTPGTILCFVRGEPQDTARLRGIIYQVLRENCKTDKVPIILSSVVPAPGIVPCLF